jgi:hypothetical protein
LIVQAMTAFVRRFLLTIKGRTVRGVHRLNKLGLNLKRAFNSPKS